MARKANTASTSHKVPARDAVDESTARAAFAAFVDIVGRVAVALVTARDSERSGFYGCPPDAITATLAGLTLEGHLYLGNVDRATLEAAARKVPRDADARLAAVTAAASTVHYGTPGHAPSLPVRIERKGQTACIGAPGKAPAPAPASADAVTLPDGVTPDMLAAFAAFVASQGK